MDMDYELISSPSINHLLTRKDRKILRKSKLRTVSKAKARLLVGDVHYQEQVEALPPLLPLPSLLRPNQRFLLSYHRKALFLFWRTTEFLPEDFRSTNWKAVFGAIRDQLGHCLCWLYVTNDLVSALRVIRGLDPIFQILCVLDFFHKIRPAIRTMVPDEEGHVCKEGDDFLTGLMFVLNNSRIRLETVADFDCPIPPSEQIEEKDVPIDDVRTYATIMEALATIEDHPLGASLALFDSFEHLKDGEIYRGPTKNHAKFIDFHAVIVTNVEMIDGEWVAECRLSNGVQIGYIKVSLSTKFMLVAENQHPTDRNYIDLSETKGVANYLLRDFAVPMINLVDPIAPVDEAAEVIGTREEGDDISETTEEQRQHGKDVLANARQMEAQNIPDSEKPNRLQPSILAGHASDILCGEGKKRKAQGTITPEMKISKLMKIPPTPLSDHLYYPPQPSTSETRHPGVVQDRMQNRYQTDHHRGSEISPQSLGTILTGEDASKHVLKAGSRVGLEDNNREAISG